MNTEKSVLRPFWVRLRLSSSSARMLMTLLDPLQAWFREMINRGKHKDDIVTNDIFLGYLKYSSERKLRGTNGKVKDSNAILSAVRHALPSSPPPSHHITDRHSCVVITEEDRHHAQSGPCRSTHLHPPPLR